MLMVAGGGVLSEGVVGLAMTGPGFLFQTKKWGTPGGFRLVNFAGHGYNLEEHSGNG